MERKKVVMLGGSFLCVVMAGAIGFLLFGDGKQPVNGQPAPVKAVSVDKVEGREMVSVHSFPMPFVSVNPGSGMVSSQSLPTPIGSGNSNVTTPQIPSSGMFPAIPKTPTFSSMEEKNLPNFGESMPPNVNLAANKTVQGILLGNGENMAVLSDGKMVREGDSFAGGTVLYIDAAGIVLDSGKRISIEKKIL